MNDVLFLTTKTELREMGTMNFFKAILDSGNEGIVTLFRKNNQNISIKFSRLGDKLKADRSIITISAFLNKLNLNNISDNTEEEWLKGQIREVNGIVRARIADEDLTDLKCFKVEYIKDSNIDYSKVVRYTDNKFINYINPSLVNPMEKGTILGFGAVAPGRSRINE